jgi:hypothetical protein
MWAAPSSCGRTVGLQNPWQTTADKTHIRQFTHKIPIDPTRSLQRVPSPVGDNLRAARYTKAYHTPLAAPYLLQLQAKSQPEAAVDVTHAELTTPGHI